MAQIFRVKGGSIEAPSHIKSKLLYHKFAVVASCIAAMIFGAELALAATPQENANRKLVLDFYRIVLEARHIDMAPVYMSENYIQHNPNVATGLSGFTAFFNKIWAEKNLSYNDVMRAPPIATAAEGDLVWLMFKRPQPEPNDPTKTYDSFSFDTFRVQNGKIVEHWDAALKPTAVPPQ